MLPLNPQAFGAVTPDSSFNTAMSFATNTNWQGYGGEADDELPHPDARPDGAELRLRRGRHGDRSSRSSAGSAAPRRRTSATSGSTSRAASLYILLPLSLVLALVLVSQGVVQNFSAYQTATLVQPTTVTTPVKDADGNPVLDEQGQPKTETSPVTEQTLPMGPAASQIAIKQLGTNGGGFFNVNSAHPYENPTPLSNFFEMLAILLIGAALCYTFGQMVGDTRQGWAVLAAMTVIFVALLALCVWAEYQGNPRIAALGVDSVASNLQPGGNMEGKEVRFGVANSALWATATTAASNGSVNSMHDSFTPLGGLVPLFMIQLGEVIFGGVGCGLYGMLVFAIIAVFVAGLMVGRTPEYLGKKIEAYEMKMASLVILIPPIVVLALHRARRRDGGRPRRAREQGRARLQRDPLRLQLDGRTTTGARSPGSRRTSPSTTRSAASRCSSRATGSPSRRSPSPARWRRRSACRSAPGRSRRTRRSSSSC